MKKSLAQSDASVEQQDRLLALLMKARHAKVGCVVYRTASNAEVLTPICAIVLCHGCLQNLAFIASGGKYEDFFHQVRLWGVAILAVPLQTLHVWLDHAPILEGNQPCCPWYGSTC